jgi:Fe-S cluster biogenesis protein NfuA
MYFRKRLKLFLAATAAMFTFAVPAPAQRISLTGIDPQVATDQEAGGMMRVGDPGGFAPAGRAARDIWLAPQGLPPPLKGAVDYEALFKPDAPWKAAAAHTKVFKLYSSYVVQTPLAQISAMVADLSRRGIPIALEDGAMNMPPNPPSGCGGLGNVEGYETVARANRIAGIIKAAHGQIKFLAMDEPFYYGHVYTHFLGKGQGCHSPVAAVLQLIKPTLDAYIQQFPDIVIGDIEPTRLVGDDPYWQDDLSQWIFGFKATMGRPLAFDDLDVEWPRGTKEPDAVYHQLEVLKDMRLIGQIGVIYDGTSSDTTDAAWVQDAESHIRLIEDQLHWRVDRAIIQSWDPNPTHALPETAPDTLTHLVDFCIGRGDPR